MPVSVATVALVGALVALAAAAAVGLATARGRRASEARLAEGLRQIGDRMDDLARELALALDEMRRDAVRARIVHSFAQPLDAEELLLRCAEAAAALPGVAGADVTVDVDGTRLTAAAGALTGAGAYVVPPPPGEGAVRAIALSYHYPASATGDGRARSAIAVPVPGSGGARLGFLTVFGPDEEPPVSGSDFLALEEIALQAGPALEAARAREQAAPAGGDPLTGLPARRDLHDTLAVEVARARRHGGRLVLCLLELDDLGPRRPALGVAGGDAAVATAADALRAAAGADARVFRHGADGFAAVLRGAGRIEGEALVARFAASLAPGGPTDTAGTGIVAGVAELKDDDDGLSLFARAERSLRRSRGQGTAA